LPALQEFRPETFCNIIHWNDISHYFFSDCIHFFRLHSAAIQTETHLLRPAFNENPPGSFMKTDQNCPEKTKTPSGQQKQTLVQPGNRKRGSINNWPQRRQVPRIRNSSTSFSPLVCRKITDATIFHIIVYETQPTPEAGALFEKNMGSQEETGIPSRILENISGFSTGDLGGSTVEKMWSGPKSTGEILSRKRKQNFRAGCN